jgi:hypothetical protein
MATVNFRHAAPNGALPFVADFCGYKLSGPLGLRTCNAIIAYNTMKGPLGRYICSTMLKQILGP